MHSRVRTQVGVTNRTPRGHARGIPSYQYSPKPLDQSIVMVPFSVAQQPHAPVNFYDTPAPVRTPVNNTSDFNLSTLLTPRAATAAATSTPRTSQNSTTVVTSAPGALISPTSVVRRRASTSVKLGIKSATNTPMEGVTPTPPPAAGRMFNFERHQSNGVVDASMQSTQVAPHIAAPATSHDLQIVQNARTVLAQLTSKRPLQTIYASLAVAQRGDPLPNASLAPVQSNHSVQSDAALPMSSTVSGAAALITPRSHPFASSEGGGGGTGTSHQTRTPHAIRVKISQDVSALATAASSSTPRPSTSVPFSPRTPHAAKFHPAERTPAQMDLAMAARNPESDTLSAAQFATLARACGAPSMNHDQASRLFATVVAAGMNIPVEHVDIAKPVAFATLQRGIGHANPAEYSASALTPRPTTRALEFQWTATHDNTNAPRPSPPRQRTSLVVPENSLNMRTPRVAIEHAGLTAQLNEGCAPGRATPQTPQTPQTPRSNVGTPQRPNLRLNLPLTPQQTPGSARPHTSSHEHALVSARSSHSTASMWEQTHTPHVEYAVPTQPHHRDVETWHITEPRPHTAFYLAPEDRFHTTLSTSQAQIRLERAPTNPLPSPAYRDGPAKLVLIASPRGKEKAALADALRTSYLAPSEASQRAVDHRDASLQSPVSAQLSARSAALSATAVNADERAQRLLSSVARGMRAFVGETRTTFNVAQDVARRASQHDEHIRSMSAQHTRWLGALAQIDARPSAKAHVEPPKSMRRSPLSLGGESRRAQGPLSPRTESANVRLFGDTQ